MWEKYLVKWKSYVAYEHPDAEYKYWGVLIAIFYHQATEKRAQQYIHIKYTLLPYFFIFSLSYLCLPRRILWSTKRSGLPYSLVLRMLLPLSHTPHSLSWYLTAWLTCYYYSTCRPLCAGPQLQRRVLLSPLQSKLVTYYPPTHNPLVAGLSNQWRTLSVTCAETNILARSWSFLFPLGPQVGSPSWRSFPLLMVFTRPEGFHTMTHYESWVMWRETMSHAGLGLREEPLYKGTLGA